MNSKGRVSYFCCTLQSSWETGKIFMSLEASNVLSKLLSCVLQVHVILPIHLYKPQYPTKDLHSSKLNERNNFMWKSCLFIYICIKWQRLLCYFVSIFAVKVVFASFSLSCGEWGTFSNSLALSSPPSSQHNHHSLLKNFSPEEGRIHYLFLYKCIVIEHFKFHLALCPSKFNQHTAHSTPKSHVHFLWPAPCGTTAWLQGAGWNSTFSFFKSCNLSCTDSYVFLCTVFLPLSLISEKQFKELKQAG